jgi:undecaprenyl-diphosphatase
MSEISGFWSHPLRLLRQWGLVPLIVLGLAAGATLAFAKIADEVIEGDTHGFDNKILMAMRNPHDTQQPWGPHWLQEMARDFTALGGAAVVAGLSVVTVGYLLLAGRGRAALVILIAVGGGVLLSLLLKQGFDRPRPDLFPHGSYVATSSFPSGHSMMSAIVYLTLGALLLSLQPSYRLRAYVMAVPVVLTLLVGLSRVYLAVHWPTDVLAGWAAGGAWALVCWLLSAKLLGRGARFEA